VLKEIGALLGEETVRFYDEWQFVFAG